MATKTTLNGFQIFSYTLAAVGHLMSVIATEGGCGL